jgi:hypothetical protein
MAKRKPRTFTCEGCGDTWDHDPRLTAACPTCKAPAGVACVRPSEHRLSASFGNSIHALRRKLSFEIAPCTCLKNWDEAQAAKDAKVKK